MQPYPCATTTVTPAGRTALCPLRSILGAIGHLVKTKDLSAFAAGTNEPRSVSRPQSRLTRGRLPVCRQSKFFLQRDAPYHAYHAPFPSARRTLPRIPRISRTLSVGRGAPHHAYHAHRNREHTVIYTKPVDRLTSTRKGSHRCSQSRQLGRRSQARRG